MPGGEVYVNNCENRAGLLKRFLRHRNGINKNNLETYIKLYQYHKRIAKLTLRKAIIEAIRV